MNRPTSAPSNNLNSFEGKERSAVDEEEETVTNEHEATGVKTAESKRSETAERNTYRTPKAGGNSESQTLELNMQEDNGTDRLC